MGRPKKPTKIVKLMGNPGKRPLNKDEPQPREGIPEKPKNLLSKEASAEWDRIVPELEACGLLTKIDYAVLLGYCQAFGNWSKAVRMVAKHGTVVESPNGLKMTSPYVTQQNQAAALMRQFANDFGLSPASRAKVTMTGQKPEEDPLNKYAAKK